MSKKNDLAAENRCHRVTKQNSREKSRFILEKSMDDKGLADWSKDPSDFEDELKGPKFKRLKQSISSSDDDSEDENIKKNVKQNKQQPRRSKQR